MDIDPIILPHAVKQNLSAAYALAFNACEDTSPEEKITPEQAWELFAQHTWEVAFGASFPGGENISFEAAHEAFLADMEEWAA